jgi:C_GCAxxG_C_C family probable redox protein
MPETERMIKMTHAEKAVELFANGCNCSQAVFTAFSDVTGMDEELAKRLSSSFGGGIGRMREICGACSGMFMAAGILYGADTDRDDKLKAEHYKRIQHLAGKFKEVHGTMNCAELLKNLSVTKDPTPEKRTEQYYKVRPCVRFVRTAAEILDEYIAENEPK